MPRKVRISVLAENTAQGAGLLAEHGLAYWIEWDGRNALFDTGQGNILAGNAYRLNIPLHEADQQDSRTAGFQGFQGHSTNYARVAPRYRCCEATRGMRATWRGHR
jgi:hypothetical protein